MSRLSSTTSSDKSSRGTKRKWLSIRARDPRTILLLRKRSKIHSRIKPIVDRLGARWLKFCRERHTWRVVVDVVPRDPATLAQHEYFGELKDVLFHNFEVAFEEDYRAGPLEDDSKLSDQLQKAMITYNTCIMVCVGFWEYLLRVFEGTSTHVNNRDSRLMLMFQKSLISSRWS